jgi:hypothetical protein
MRFLLILLFLSAVLGCATDPAVHRGTDSVSSPSSRGFDSIDNSDAAGDAFAGDGMFYKKPMKSGDKGFEFFSKHCSVETEGFSFVSKRVYSCTDAY